MRVPIRTSASVELDPYDPAVHTDPYPVYSRLRDELPAYHNAERGFWALSRHADVIAAVADPATFSSVGRVNLDAEDAPGIPILIEMDAPRHTELRGIVQRAFTPRRVASLEVDVRCLARQLLDDMPDGAADFVAACAGPLPITVIARILGIPESDWPRFQSWSDALVRRGPDGSFQDESIRAGLELLLYFGEVVARRRVDPDDDLLSALVEAQAGGEAALTDDDLYGFCLLLLVAGHETTTTLLCNAVRAFSDHADAWTAVRNDSRRIPAAVEEVLRYDGPVLGMGRVLTVDVTLHGETIHAGERVLLLYGAANRDPRAFPAADRFDIGRRLDRHLAFGHGAHFCVGAALARLEARVVLEEMAKRFTVLHVDAAGIERRPQVNLRSVARMPVELIRT